MGLLRLAVLGPPEVMHDGSRLAFALRKAQALLLYLAVRCSPTSTPLLPRTAI